MTAARQVFVALVVALLLVVATVAALQYRTLHVTRARLAAVAPSAVDVGFAQFMSLHHQQAVVMAQLMRDDESSAVANLAQSIIGAQLLELGEMRGWLRLWNKPFFPESRAMSWMLLGDDPPSQALAQYLLDCEASPTGMPGLATDQQLNRLRSLQGLARSRLFLELMLAHHEGGIPMARFAAKNARIHAVRRVASNIVLEQTKEVAGIRVMLHAIRSVPLSD